MQVVRIDKALEILKPQDHPSGYLTASVVLGRTGILEYFDRASGKVRRELVMPETLNDPESIATIEGVPVTNEHPPKMLTSADAKDFQVGMVHKDVAVDGNLLIGAVTITDAKTIADVKSGKKVQVSPGYVCEVVDSPGIWEGQPYDAVQRHRVYNHLAVVARGRNGSQVAIKLDGAMEELPMAKIVVKGVELEVSETAALAIQQKFDEDGVSMEQLKKKIDECNSKMESLSGERDELVKQMDAMKKDECGKKKMDSDEINTLVNARLALIEKAKAVAPAAKFDGADDLGIMKAVLLEKAPELKDKMDSLSSEYVKARFDVMCEMVEKEKVADQAKTVAAPASRTDSVNSLDVRKQMIEAQKSGNFSEKK